MGLFYNHAGLIEYRLLFLMLSGIFAPQFITYIPYLFSKEIIPVRRFEYYLCINLGVIFYVLGALFTSDVFTVNNYWWMLIPIIGFPVIAVSIMKLIDNMIDYLPREIEEAYYIISLVTGVQSFGVVFIALIGINYSAYPPLVAVAIITLDIYIAYRMGQTWDARIWHSYWATIYSIVITAIYSGLLIQNISAVLWGGRFGLLLLLLYKAFYYEGMRNETRKYKMIRKVYDQQCYKKHL